jgi:hypothetical protein
LAVDGLDKAAHGAVIAHVKGRSKGLHAKAIRGFAGYGFKWLLSASTQRQMGAFRGECESGGFTDSLAGCGNDGDTVF